MVADILKLKISHQKVDLECLQIQNQKPFKIDLEHQIRFNNFPTKSDLNSILSLRIVYNFQIKSDLNSILSFTIFCNF